MTEVQAALSPFGVKTVGPTISDLPPAARAHLERHGQVRQYRQNQDVISHMAVPTSACWLLEGRLRSLRLQEDGSEQAAGWTLPGELFAVGNMLLETPYRLTTRVDTPEARVLHFSRQVLLDMMDRLPEARVGIATGLSRRLVQLYDMIDASRPRNLTDRLRKVLLWWSNHYGVPARDGSVELWITQADLANGVGGSRQRVHIELQDLQSQGEITLGYRKLVLMPRFFDRLTSS